MNTIQLNFEFSMNICKILLSFAIFEYYILIDLNNDSFCNRGENVLELSLLAVNWLIARNCRKLT